MLYYQWLYKAQKYTVVEFLVMYITSVNHPIIIIQYTAPSIACERRRKEERKENKINIAAAAVAAVAVQQHKMTSST